MKRRELFCIFNSPVVRGIWILCCEFKKDKSGSTETDLHRVSYGRVRRVTKDQGASNGTTSKNNTAFMLAIELRLMGGKLPTASSWLVAFSLRISLLWTSIICHCGSPQVTQGQYYMMHCRQTVWAIPNFCLQEGRRKATFQTQVLFAGLWHKNYWKNTKVGLEKHNWSRKTPVVFTTQLYGLAFLFQTLV